MKKMISISSALAIFIFVAFITTIIVAAILAPKLRDYERMKERQEDRMKIHLRHQGGSALYYPPNWDKEKDGSHFNYEIRSWDGGMNWYAIDHDFDSKEFKILGDAEELYPGLLEHIIGMDQLTKHVQDNGSIKLDGTDPLGVDALENAGFTVKKDTTK